MTKNYMLGVAKLLGVELGERFKICSRGCAKLDFPLFNNDYFLDEKGGLMCGDKDSFCKAPASVLGEIILGNFEIMKLPWSPEYGDDYFVLNFKTRRIERYFWGATTFDLAVKSLGIIHRTKEEAEAHLAEDYERLTGRPLSSC